MSESITEATTSPNGLFSDFDGQWVRDNIVRVLLVFLGMFHVTSSIWGIPNTAAFQLLHLTPMIIITLLKKKFRNRADRLSNVVDFSMCLILVGIMAYILRDLYAYVVRPGNPLPGDIIAGTLYILILLEAGRRVAGNILVILAVFFFTHNLFSDLLFGILRAVPVKYSTLVDFTFMRTSGIFGIPVQTMSSYVLLFMIFAALLNISGAGTFFIDIAQAITGKSRGGPAKAAVVASAGFGSISGSAIANVAGTGCITIPLMKSTGYDAEFSGAVEAVASTGGQFMPPMMGATAFIIAQELGMPYIELALYALIPALLYFAAVYFMIDFRAGKLNLKGSNLADMPKIKETMLKGGHLLIPIIVIVGLMAMGRTPQYSAMISIVVFIFVSYCKKWTRLDGRRILQGISDGVEDTSSVSVTCGTAGILISGITMTGLSLRFSQEIMSLSFGLLPLALVMVALAAIVMGMGMVTVAVYVTVAAVMAPPLIRMGVSPLAAHMFVNYYGCLSTITPPVALAAYTAAGISGASASKTGWTSFRLGIAAYIIPFTFAYNPVLLMQGSPLDIAVAALTALIGCWALAAAVEGYIFSPLSAWQRIVMVFAALCSIIPGWSSDMVGIALVAAIVMLQLKARRQRAVPEEVEI